VVRTLVIDGVANGEDPEDGGKDRSGRCVLSVEELGLQSSKVRLRGWSLGEFRVKVDEWGEASSRSSGLYRRNQKTRTVRRRGTPHRRTLATYEEGWRSDLRWDDAAKLATNNGGVHNYFGEYVEDVFARRESSCWTCCCRWYKQRQITVVAPLVSRVLVHTRNTANQVQGEWAPTGSK